MVNNVNSTGASSQNWWSNGSAGFLEQQRTTGHWGRFGPPGANNASASPGVQNQLVGIRSAAEGLRTSARDMQGLNPNNTPMSANNPTSSDADLMTITRADANRLRNAGVTDFNVDILQTAQAQQNEGVALNSTALASAEGFEVGSNQISITVGNRQFDFTFNVSATDTARDVQNRISNAVNARSNETGVRASITQGTGDNAGTSTLTFQSAQTGVNTNGQPNFTVSGSAASVTGVTSITQQAQNAEFRVNRNGQTGFTQTSRTNNVDLGHGVTAELRDAGNVDVTMERNETDQINAFRDMVNQFNNLMEAARRGGNNRDANRLENQLHDFAASNAGALARVGISMNRDGFLSINEGQMRTAAQNGALANFAGDGRAGGFGPLNRLERIADGVISNPAGFVNTSGPSRDDFDFNLFQNGRMNNAINMGMLFDSWI